MEKFETVSINLTTTCNKSCKYCSLIRDRELASFDFQAVKRTISNFKDAGVQKIIFTGGEAFQRVDILKDILTYCKKLGLITSVTTNGSYINDSSLHNLKPFLDEINLTVDSLSSITNIKSGRFISEIDEIDYYQTVYDILRFGFNLNIHTVVHSHNQYENLQNFIQFSKPGYWLIEPVKNSALISYNEIKAQENNYSHFKSKHVYHTIIEKLNIPLYDCYGKLLNK